MPAKKTIKKKVVKKRVNRKSGRKPVPITEKMLNHMTLGAKNGLNEEEIAKSVGISYTTLRNYKNKDDIDNCQITAAIKKGREQGRENNIRMVKNALLRKCLGEEYEEVTIERRGELNKKNEFTAGGKVVQKKVKKKVLPSDTAIIFYLCNNDPEEYQSINKVEINNQLPKQRRVVQFVLSDKVKKNKKGKSD